MGKKMLSAIIAGSLFFTFTAGYTCAEKPVSALTVIATVKNVTVEKDTIAVGESVNLELEWGTGAKQELFFSTDNESVATVDQDGVVTGVGNGTAEITVSHSNYGSDKTITITVSEDVRASVCYNTSELTLGMKLYKYDKLHYDGKNIGGTANIVNDKGSYDLAFVQEKDYLLPFDAELVGIDGLTIYLAPELENVKYIDGRTLSAGDVIDTSSHLLCYDYHINKCVLPVFLPEYYEKYIGEGEIRVKDIDHENKTITLEAVGEFNWLPVTMDDYTQFIEMYGNVSVHGNYIVYCDTINYSTGSEVILEQVGTAEIKQVKEYSISTGEVPVPAGSQSYVVYVYEAISSGTVEVTILQGRAWDSDAPKEIKDFGKYEISEDLNITEVDNTQYGIGVSNPPAKTEYFIGEELDLTGLRLNGSITKFEDGEELQGCIIDEDYFDLIERGTDIRIDASEFNNKKAGTYNIYVTFGNAKDSFKVTVIDEKDSFKNGDVNADGSFNVADAVMLQQWLSATSDITISDWKNADFNNDGVLNVFDLCLMKRELINQKQYDDTPVLLIDDYIITQSENGWGSEQYYRVITANGNRYSTEAFTVEPEDGYEWTVKNDVRLIMTEGEKEQYITDEEVLKKISEFTKNAAKYKDCEMTKTGLHVEDYGQTTLSVLYKDENGDMQSLELYRFGGDCAWLDNEEVQEFVDMLIYGGYIDGPLFFAYVNPPVLN